MRWLDRIFGLRTPARGDNAYREAMKESAELSHMLRISARSTDAARALMADIWAQNNNIPFLTSVTETVQEMKSPLEQRPSDLPR